MTGGRSQKPPLYTGRSMQIFLADWIVIFAYFALHLRIAFLLLPAVEWRVP